MRGHLQKGWASVGGVWCLADGQSDHAAGPANRVPAGVDMERNERGLLLRVGKEEGIEILREILREGERD